MGQLTKSNTGAQGTLATVQTWWGPLCTAGNMVGTPVHCWKYGVDPCALLAYARSTAQFLAIYALSIYALSCINATRMHRAPAGLPGHAVPGVGRRAAKEPARGCQVLPSIPVAAAHASSRTPSQREEQHCRADHHPLCTSLCRHSGQHLVHLEPCSRNI
jgi:hypothetical protein